MKILNFSELKCVIAAAPLTPNISWVQNSLTEFPIGLTTPNPVTTALLRLMKN